ncbi:MAG: ATP-binding protein [Pedobacter sp.]|jgi:signal transduction histidine kinase|uniref:HAMP domain-containing sensor histidine kinase n=1 Tax=Pedobacter sp. TaxID=1411316 RepID=UPI00356177C4
MKIKTKLRLGFIFLFLIIISFGGISMYQINRIADHAKVVLKDNYKSLVYVNEMRIVLDEQNEKISNVNSAKFEKALRLEEKNITENGEKLAATKLRKAFNTALKPADKNEYTNAIAQMRVQLRAIDELNMNAIVRKNAKAQQATEKATIYLGVTAFVSFLILFSFIVNFPGFIANPLRELLDGIREISRKNYQQRLHFEGSDEFGELASAFNKMALELKNWDNTNVAKLKSEKQRIETIIEQMQDAIIGANEKREILFFNKVAGELLNLAPKDAIGRDIDELAKRNELLKTVLLPKANEEPLKIFADGKESFFLLEKREITAPNLDDQSEGIVTSLKSAGQVYVLKNITKFKELDEAKTNFIATVSHELKTPLSSIKMSLKLLNDERVGSMNQEQLQLIGHIQEDSERLLKITGELLDLAQVETGNLQLNMVISDPIDIVNIAVEAVRFQAEQKDIALELIGTADKLPNVNADVQKTAWVLVNFLSNALRYSSIKSKITLQVKLADNFIEFSVRDFGKGIEEQYQKKLFDRYYQVPTDGQNKSGSGLGLAISKDFIEAEQGRIWVESALGEGSRFCFTLPTVINN